MHVNYMYIMYSLYMCMHVLRGEGCAYGVGNC